MKLFKSSKGFVFAFGFDMQTRLPDNHVIAWNDPGTGSWEIKPTTLAGGLKTDFVIAPEFVFETRDGIVAYQPGRCIELTYIGGPYVWQMTSLFADEPQRAAA